MEKVIRIVILMLFLLPILSFYSKKGKVNWINLQTLESTYAK